MMEDGCLSVAGTEGVCFVSVYFYERYVINGAMYFGEEIS